MRNSRACVVLTWLGAQRALVRMRCRSGLILHIRSFSVSEWQQTLPTTCQLGCAKVIVPSLVYGPCGGSGSLVRLVRYAGVQAGVRLRTSVVSSWDWFGITGVSVGVLSLGIKAAMSSEFQRSPNASMVFPSLRGFLCAAGACPNAGIVAVQVKRAMRTHVYPNIRSLGYTMFLCIGTYACICVYTHPNFQLGSGSYAYSCISCFTCIGLHMRVYMPFAHVGLCTCMSANECLLW